MTELALLGMGTGAGITLVLLGLRRTIPSLDTVVRQYSSDKAVGGRLRGSEPGIGRRGGTEPGGLLTRLGARLVGLAYLVSPRQGVAQDLALVGRSADSLSLQVAVASLAGGAFPLGLGLIATTAGTAAPAAAVIAVGLTGMVVGALWPVLHLRQLGGRARSSFVRSLSCWLELVALAQAGGMGIEGALGAASGVSDDPSFVTVRRALARARHSGASPWEALGQLGERLGVPELEELSASVALAGTEGARVRSSLSAKSASLRRRQMAESEATANATTERLFLPAIVLMFGFMIFLVYPAAASLTHVLGPSVP